MFHLTDNAVIDGFEKSRSGRSEVSRILPVLRSDEEGGAAKNGAIADTSVKFI